RRVLIIDLAGAMVDSRAGADYGFTFEYLRRPGEADARVPVVAIREIPSRAVRAEAAACKQVEHPVAIGHFPIHAVELIPQSEVQGEFRSDLDVVLRIRVVVPLARAQHGVAATDGN